MTICVPIPSSDLYVCNLIRFVRGMYEISISAKAFVD